MIAECYRLTNDPKNAETWYRLSVKSATSKPEAQYWLAESLKKTGKYQQAIEEFKKYKQVAPSDSRADQQIRACELALEWQRNPEAYRVEELKDLNSKDSDFSPAYGEMILGSYYFTSSREDAPGKQEHMAQQDRASRIYLKAVWIRNQNGAPRFLLIISTANRRMERPVFHPITRKSILQGAKQENARKRDA